MEMDYVELRYSVVASLKNTCLALEGVEVLGMQVLPVKA